tara:strand:- start:300 stop:449 length:150 start_codon:yes stop_codon:yes gene_type:complete
MKDLLEIITDEQFKKQLLEKKSKEECKKISLDEIFDKLEKLYENGKNGN